MEIHTDLDFYCYLKKELQGEYKIIAEPSADYFSEWLFCYKIFKNNVLIETIKGDFRKIEKGELVKKAKSILKKIKSNKI